MDEIWVIVYFISGLWNSSLASFLYLLIGLSLLVRLLFRPDNPRTTYIIALIYSSILLVARVTIGIVSSTDCCSESIEYLENNTWLGLYFISPKEDAGIFLEFILPDLICIPIGILGITKKFNLEPRFSKIRRKISLGILIMLGTALVNNTFFNLVYLCLAGICGICWGYRYRIRPYRLILASASLITGAQLTLSFIVMMFGNSLIPSRVCYMIGIFEWGWDLPADYIGALLRLLTSAFFARKMLIQEPEYIRLESEIVFERDQIRRTSGTNRINSFVSTPASNSNSSLGTFIESVPSKVPFRALLVGARIMIILWIMRLHSFPTMIFMIWVFYTVLEASLDRLMMSVSYVILPYTVVYFIGFYVVLVLGLLDHFYNEEIEGYIEAATVPYLAIFLGNLILIRYKYVSGNWRSETITELTLGKVLIVIFYQNADKTVLFALFLISLSEINVFHSIFMIISIVLMLFRNRAKKSWFPMILYTEGVILIRYLWHLLLAYDAIPQHNHIVYQIIGLPTDYTATDSEWTSTLVYEIDLWSMLLLEGIQLKIYRSEIYNFKIDPEEVVNKWPKLCRLMATVTDVYRKHQIWVAYFILYMVITLSLLDFLNWVRFCLLLIYISIHIFSSSLHRGLRRVKKSWFIITYYSGIVMGIRYFYQFAGFFPNHDNYVIRMVGIRIFETTTLLASMIPDCLILLFCVINNRYLIDIDIKSSVTESSLLERQPTGLIKRIIFLESMKGEITPIPKLSKYICDIFSCINYALVFILAIYWRLSVSMFILVIITSTQLIRISNFYCRKVANLEAPFRGEEYSLKLPYFVFSAGLLIIFNALQYMAFIFKYDIGYVSENTLRWTIYFLGFNEVAIGSLFPDIFGYGVLLLVFMIERNCIEYISDFSHQVSFQPKAKSWLTLLLGFFRFIFEAGTPTGLIFLAYRKLTVVSILYILTVLVGIGMINDKIKRAKFFNFVLVLMILAQYGIMLSNISNKIAPNTTSADSPEYIPWYYQLNSLSDDQITFLNLGSTSNHLLYLFYDMVFLFLNHIYVRYLLLCYLPYSQESPEKLKKRRKSKFYKLSRKVKYVLYRLSNIVILTLVLFLFPFQTGLISTVFLLVVLICIYRANDELVRTKDPKFTTKAIRRFLIPAMCTMYLAEIVYQLPYDEIHTDDPYSWPYAIGIYRLWEAGESESIKIEERFKKVYCSVFSFFLLYLLYLLNQDDRIRKYRRKKRAQDKLNALSIGLELAQTFNDLRLERYEVMKDRSLHLEDELDKLDLIVSKWNNRFHKGAHQIARPSGGVQLRKTFVRYI